MYVRYVYDCRKYYTVYPFTIQSIPQNKTNYIENLGGEGVWGRMANSI